MSVSAIKFPTRINSSLEDKLLTQSQNMAQSAVGSVHIMSDWNDIFDSRPFDSVYYTALNGRACMLVYFSRAAVPEIKQIEWGMSSSHGMKLHVAAFLQGSYPILRCNFIIPIDPSTPRVAESPLDLRDGDVQDFFLAVSSDETIDLFIKHQDSDKTRFQCACQANGIAKLMEEELTKVVRHYNAATSQMDFRQSVRLMESVIPTSDSHIDPSRLVALLCRGKVQNELIDKEYNFIKEREEQAANDLASRSDITPIDIPLTPSNNDDSTNA